MMRGACSTGFFKSVKQEKGTKIPLSSGVRAELMLTNNLHNNNNNINKHNNSDGCSSSHNNNNNNHHHHHHHTPFPGAARTLCRAAAFVAPAGSEAGTMASGAHPFNRVKLN